MAGKVGPPFGSKNRQTHGMVGTRMYGIWKGMKYRCDSPHYYQFHRYGGRGIEYDPKWARFENFYEDMKDTYRDNLTIERIDIDGDYCKENCKWIPMSEQKNNTSKSHWVTINGQTKTLRDWVRESDVKYQTALARMKRGVEPRQALGLGG